MHRFSPFVHHRFSPMWVHLTCSKNSAKQFDGFVNNSKSAETLILTLRSRVNVVPPWTEMLCEWYKFVARQWQAGSVLCLIHIGFSQCLFVNNVKDYSFAWIMAPIIGA